MRTGSTLLRVIVLDSLMSCESGSILQMKAYYSLTAELSVRKIQTAFFSPLQWTVLLFELLRA
jgi:hypothetical protein